MSAYLMSLGNPEDRGRECPACMTILERGEHCPCDDEADGEDD